MAGVEMGIIVTALEEALAGLVAAGEVEIALGEDETEVEVVADEWTLHLEGWPQLPLAFLAIEDEPEAPGAISAARAAVMDDSAVRALADADRRLGGVLSATLRASGDPLSLDLAAALERTRDAESSVKEIG